MRIYAIIFRKGQKVRVVEESAMVSALMEEVVLQQDAASPA